MKRTIFLTVMGLVWIFSAFGQTAVELDTAIAQASRDISPKIIVGPNVALMNVSSQANNFSAYVLREMALIVEKDRKLRVIGRQDIDTVLGQSNLRITSEVTDKVAQEIGKKLNVDYVVTAYFEKMNDNYRFRTRLVTIFNGDVQPLSTINVLDTPQLRQLLGIAATPAPATAVPAPTAPVVAAPSVPAVTLANGTYTLTPRPRGRLDGVWEDIYVSRVVVDSEYITFFFENRATAGDGYGGDYGGGWDRNRATLTDLDKPTVYQKSINRTTSGSGRVITCVFPRMNAKRLKLESSDKMIFAEIILDESD